MYYYCFWNGLRSTIQFGTANSLLERPQQSVLEWKRCFWDTLTIVSYNVSINCDISQIPRFCVQCLSWTGPMQTSSRWCPTSPATPGRLSSDTPSRSMPATPGKSLPATPGRSLSATPGKSSAATPGRSFGPYKPIFRACYGFAI